MIRYAQAGRLARFAVGCVSLKPVATLLVLSTAAMSMVGCPARPSILVFPSGFNFGTTILQDNLTIINNGVGEVNWTITGLPIWLSVSEDTGTATPDNASTVTMTINRSLVPVGTTSEEFIVESNAGDVTVTVSVERAGESVPTLGVDPVALNFGNQLTQRTFTIINLGAGDLDWTVTSDDAALEVSPAAGTTISSTPTDITVTLDRSGLGPGSYTPTLTVTSNGGSATIAVIYLVDGPAPNLTVGPDTLAFGAVLTTLQFTVDNTGTGELIYTITDDAPWLTINPTAGTATSEVDTIDATVDRTGLAPGDFTATITIDGGGGGSDTIAVTMSVAPPTLVVSPLSLSFGPSLSNKLFTVRNGGSGQVDWSIDTSGFPTWLSVNVTSGSVTTETDGVIVTVDRTGLPPSLLEFDIPVNSSTPGAGSALVHVTASIGTQPVLTVFTGAVNPPPGEEPLANLGSDLNVFEFTISNTGSGTLNWNMDPGQFDIWLTIAPVSGTLNAGQSQTITINVDRLNLVAGGYTDDILIISNTNDVVLEVQMQVPLRPVIGATANEIDFGIDADSSSFSVANFGDPGTLLQFFIESDKEWLFFSPESGTSIGTSSPIKDFQPVAVAIDRGNLDGTGATGTLTITARDFEGNILEDVEPWLVTVSVEAAELSFEGALPLKRIPSLIRFPFIMREFRDLAIQVAPDQIPISAFHINEKDVALDLDETNQFLTSGLLLRTNLVILLDYTGSQFNAAVQAGIGGLDPLQDLYEQEIGEFITNAPGNWQIALMEFHDRGQPTRLVQDFTTDKPTLLAALQGINVVDHGASELLNAVDDANLRLVAEDIPLASFDGADVRAILLVTDGRVTTPPGNILDTLDLLETNRVRVFDIGWGQSVNNQPLARMASESGGHYYPTLNTVAGLPQVSELSDRLDQTLSDLLAQLVLSYVTLNETDNTPVRINGVLDDPTDNPDQGIIQGSIVNVLNLQDIVGEIRLGQISMRSSGVAGGDSTVVLRAEYVPRNINEFLFTLTSTEAFTVSLVPEADGGLVSDWTLTDEGGGVFRLLSPGGAMLQYGAFGDLLNIDFTGPAVPFRLNLTVDDTIYAGDPEPKNLLFPDSVLVDADGSFAPSFPTPLVVPTSIDFGAAFNTRTFTIQNIGGSFPAAPAASIVQLRWEASLLPVFVSNAAPSNGQINTTQASGTQTVTLFADRSLAPGNYTQNLIVEYDTGGDAMLDIESTVAIVCSISIAPPLLDVTPTVLDFGMATDTLDITISNTGQSTLDFVIDTTSAPAFLGVSSTTGSVTTTPQVVTVGVDRTGLASGTSLNTSFTVISDGGSQVVTVLGSVP
jgi:hypothetical protein